MSYLERMSPSRSTILEDSTSLAGETTLTESSNGVEVCRVLPISAKHGKRELHRER